MLGLSALKVSDFCTAVFNGFIPDLVLQLIIINLVVHLLGLLKSDWVQISGPYLLEKLLVDEVSKQVVAVLIYDSLPNLRFFDQFE